MGVLLLTVFLSLILAAIFVALFIGDRARRGFGSVEHEALLPFQDEAESPRSGPPAP